MLKISRSFLLVFALVFIMLSAAWTTKLSNSLTAEPPTPGEPPEPERTLEDSDSSIKAEEHRVLSGDNFLDNLYERPFTSEEMIYQPELDIYSVDFAYDDVFFYFTIIMNADAEEGYELAGLYGIEFDLTKTGRGDMLVMTEVPGKDWSVEGISILIDEDEDVGGPVPIISDEDYEGNGYDGLFKPEGDKVTYSRLSPEDAMSVQIAVSRALLDDPGEFLWGAWADNGLKSFDMFDYNDAMGLSDAGSPIKTDDDYPIKGLFSLDNTCRLPYGFEQGSESVPGMCINVPSPAGCVPICLIKGDRTGCKKWGCQ